MEGNHPAPPASLPAPPPISAPEVPPPPTRRPATSVSMEEEWKKADMYWVRDDQHEFVAKGREDITGLELLHRRSYPIHDLKSIKEDSADLVQLEDINEASILNNLLLRFQQNQIYTSLGTIVVAINPYKWIKELYTEESLSRYEGASQRGVTDLPPHVYATAERAYYGLMEHQEDQSIVISGESGAGKTEATKKCLSYLAMVAKSTSGVEERILAANPVLEAFGNAKTLRNDNSSRFGKWMENYFDSQGRIVGCSNQNFLLEKSRVVVQDQGERNYHAFYHLISGANAETIQKYYLEGGPTSFHYVNQSGVYDLGPGRPTEESMWNELMEAMTNLKFNNSEKDGVALILATVLHLGNITFVPTEPGDEDTSKIDSSNDASSAAVEAVVQLLGWNHRQVENAMCNRKVTSGRGSSYQVPVNVSGAAEGRDALAKSMYNSLFDWLVQRVNRAVSPPVNKDHRRTNTHHGSSLLGVLDIFGFEIFETNSFEQLCINYCNERLQQQFNVTTFEEETKLYEYEGVPFEDISFEDNEAVIRLISAKRVGMLPMLDEEGRVPRGSDITWFNKVKKKI